MAGAERKAVIKNADMAEDMQQDAVECATQVSSSDEQLISSPVLFSCKLFDSFTIFYLWPPPDRVHSGDSIMRS